MKRIITLIIACYLLFGLCACGTTPNNSNSNSNSNNERSILYYKDGVSIDHELCVDDVMQDLLKDLDTCYTTTVTRNMITHQRTESTNLSSSSGYSWTETYHFEIKTNNNSYRIKYTYSVVKEGWPKEIGANYTKYTYTLRDREMPRRIE